MYTSWIRKNLIKNKGGKKYLCFARVASLPTYILANLFHMTEVTFQERCGWELVNEIKCVNISDSVQVQRSLNKTVDKV